MFRCPFTFLGQKTRALERDAKTADAALEARLFHAIALCLAWDGSPGIP
jgi:hypothetical protein